MQASRFALALATLSLITTSSAMAQEVDVHNLGAVALGETLSVNHNGLSKNGYSDNASLSNSAWAHAGGAPWYAFEVLSTSDVTIDLTPSVAGTSFSPGLTLWASGSTMFNGGLNPEGIEVGPVNGWTAPHSFNATGQIGDVGTLWASGSNGNLVQTLAYAVTGPAHTDAENNGWNEVIQTGVNDISTDDSFEQGITGSASGNAIHLSAHNLAAGWYLVYFNGSSTATSGSAGWNNYQLSISSVSAVPEPAAWLLSLAGLGLMGLMGLLGLRRRQA